MTVQSTRRALLYMALLTAADMRIELDTASMDEPLLS
jgi:hypothetical protein